MRRLEQDIGIFIASLPALRQLIAVLQQYEWGGSHSLQEKSVRSHRRLQSLPEANAASDRRLQNDNTEKNCVRRSKEQDVERDMTGSRRPSMLPRPAGLGLAVRSSQEEKLELDLIYHEDEKLSPRETPWATPRVSPRLGSFAHITGPDQSSVPCTDDSGSLW